MSVQFSNKETGNVRMMWHWGVFVQTRLQWENKYYILCVFVCVCVSGQRHALAPLPRGKTLYPLYRRLGKPQGRSGRLRKISPSLGFDPQTGQPVASCYTDWAISAH
jgi:hypothetical protein